MKPRSSLAALALLAAVATAPSESRAASCGSAEERRGVSELIAFREACDRVFPELADTTRATFAPVLARHAECHEALQATGDGRSVIALASALIQSEMPPSKKSPCTQEFPQLVDGWMKGLGK